VSQHLKGFAFAVPTLLPIEAGHTTLLLPIRSWSHPFFMDHRRGGYFKETPEDI